MNTILNQLSNLDRKYKLMLVIGNDFFFALVCWLVFGPPMATYIASEFSTGIFEIFQSEWKSFFFPASLSILYLYLFGFYKSLIKFFDSKDSIFLSLSGSLIFGFSWSIIHIYQFKIVSIFSFDFFALPTTCGVRRPDHGASRRTITQGDAFDENEEVPWWTHLQDDVVRLLGFQDLEE